MRAFTSIPDPRRGLGASFCPLLLPLGGGRCKRQTEDVGMSRNAATYSRDDHATRQEQNILARSPGWRSGRLVTQATGCGHRSKEAHGQGRAVPHGLSSSQSPICRYQILLTTAS